MEPGLVGLGKIEMNMVERMRRDNHETGRLMVVLRNEFGGHAVVENRQ
jgi:6-phosphogluconate dehydrogenase (decarboxylating)